MAKKKIEKQYLDFLDGWMYAERDFSCVGQAVLIPTGHGWSSWHVSSTVNSGENWKFQHALAIHGKDSQQ